MEMKNDVFEIIEFLKHNINYNIAERVIKTYIWMMIDYKSINELSDKDKEYINKIIIAAYRVLNGGKYQLGEYEVKNIFSILEMLKEYGLNKEIKNLINYYYFNKDKFKDLDYNRIYFEVLNEIDTDVNKLNTSQLIEVEILYNNKEMDFLSEIKNEKYLKKIRELGITDAETKTAKEIVNELIEKGSKLKEKNNKYLKQAKLIQNKCFMNDLKGSNYINCLINIKEIPERDEEEDKLRKEIIVHYFYINLCETVEEKISSENYKELIKQNKELEKNVYYIISLLKDQNVKRLIKIIRKRVEITNAKLKETKEFDEIKYLKLKAMSSISFKKEKEAKKNIIKILFD